MLLSDVFGRRVAMAVDNARLFAAEQTARQEAERHSERVTRLQAITAAFSRAHTPVEVEQAVVEVAQRTLGVAGGVVMAVDEHPSVAVHWQPRFRRGAGGRLAGGAVRRAAARRRGGAHGRADLARGRAERLRRYPALAATPTADAGSSASLPLLVDGRTIGLLGLSFRDERSFSAADRNLMLTLAQHCAQALERARLAQAERAAQAAATQALNAREVFR